MEHLNRMCKDAVRQLGANKTPKAIVRVGKAISSLTLVLKQFNVTNGIQDTSGYYTRRDMTGDLEKVLIEIHNKSQVFIFFAWEETSILSQDYKQHLEIDRQEKV